MRFHCKGSTYILTGNGFLFVIEKISGLSAPLNKLTLNVWRLGFIVKISFNDNEIFALSD